MSQPCSMVELVLFDTDSLDDERVTAAVEDIARRGLHCGAISDDADVAEALSRTGLTKQFDLWLPGADDRWPFDRAVALTGVEPGRILFISADGAANAAAEAAGLQTCPDDLDQIDRRLP
ncbi:MAG TPA: hypothetical protein PK593_03890 [Thermomicrobiales bacterium]|nr:hypothetical protein [Thermomicrobiales bacterium]HQZ89506.1 hypothetical protein [Thermomicrobiales bacterium]HRA32533.1 hypothetical protein [Thermomicrobiales bacterium]